MDLKDHIKLVTDTHKGEEVVSLRFRYSTKIISKVKQIDGTKWSQTMKSWYIPKQNFNLNQVFEQLKAYAYIDYSEIIKKPATKPATKKTKARPKEKAKIPQAYKNKLVQKRYAENTHKTYINYFGDFVLYFKGRDLEKITKEEINNYILELIRERDISPSQQNQRINAIKFYYEKVLGKTKEYYNIERPRKENKLPDVLSKDEIRDMLKNVGNKKHKVIIALIYSCGLRRSEIINLRINDIDSNRMMIKIRGAKGKKDRYVQLSSGLLQLLREYYTEFSPDNWLLAGQKGNQYSAESVFNVIKNTALRAGIKRRVYPHLLRHSYATHQLEQGIDIRYIQEWMGHGSIKTTERYTHVSDKNFKNFKNPLDDLL